MHRLYLESFTFATRRGWYTGMLVTNLIVQEGETTAMNETSLASLWS